MSDTQDADEALLEAMLGDWAKGEFWDPTPYADDVVFVRAGPDGGEYHGIEGLSAAWRDFLSAWQDFRVQAEGIVPGGRGVYALLLRLQARGKGSGVEIDAEVANVVRMRDGRIHQLEMFWDRAEALTAAGAHEEAG